MLTSVAFRLRSPGPGSGLRRLGGKGLLLALAGLTLSGCATKRDLRDLRDEIRALATQQDAALAELEGINLQVRDTLRGQADAIFESRGETTRRLREIEDQLIRLMELTGQNQRSLMALRDLMEARGAAYSPSQIDPGGGEVTDPGDRAGGAEATYNVAVTQFNRGSFVTARRAFEQFLQEHPGHSLASDAHFYLADILVQENRLDEAIAAFLEIPEFDPMAPKAPDALYRVGVLYIELENLDQARVYLERVVTSYSESGVAILARQRLAEIS
ncbi:tetratricopeptide repeat protein [Gemmatimonadota bacterium]